MATENKELDPKVLEQARSLVDEALGILEKSDVNEDPEGEQMEVVDPMGGEEKPAEEAAKSEESEESEEKKDEEKPEDKKEDEDEESDDDVQKSYEAALAKMKDRGLIKSETAQEAPKAETKVEAPKADEDLRKSIDERFASLNKTIEGLTDLVNKIAKTPVGRKGVTGVQPLKKNDDEGKQEAPKMSKAEAVQKLLTLQKSGNSEVTPLLISKFEAGRGITKREFETIKRLVSQP